MNATPTPAPNSLSLLVPEPPAAQAITPPDQEDQVREETSSPLKLLKRRFTRQPADLTKLRNDLDRVQGEVDALLKDQTDSKVGNLRLNEVQVSLGISAEGSIGVVTAGVTASITLVYART
jgi:hypothetical protein